MISENTCRTAFAFLDLITIQYPKLVPGHKYIPRQTPRSLVDEQRQRENESKKPEQKPLLILDVLRQSYTKPDEKARDNTLELQEITTPPSRSQPAPGLSNHMKRKLPTSFRRSSPFISKHKKFRRRRRSRTNWTNQS
jgi:hypothetical protein